MWSPQLVKKKRFAAYAVATADSLHYGEANKQIAILMLFLGGDNNTQQQRHTHKRYTNKMINANE